MCLVMSATIIILFIKTVMTAVCSYSSYCLVGDAGKQMRIWHGQVQIKLGDLWAHRGKGTLPRREEQGMYYGEGTAKLKCEG